MRVKRVVLTCDNRDCGKQYSVSQSRHRTIIKTGYYHYCCPSCGTEGRKQHRKANGKTCVKCGGHTEYRVRTRDLRCKLCHDITKINGGIRVG